MIGLHREGGTIMSRENPGVIFDAASSWNGYNHQGKLAILIAIKQILEVYDNTLSVDDNRSALEEYFIEIEYLEDFSIGRHTNGKDEYYYIHQVKNHAAKNAKDYDSALLGLAYHVESMPTLKNAFLHATTDIDFKGKTVHDYVKQLIYLPAELNKILLRINEARSDENKKQKLYAKHNGRQENFISKLKKSLIEADSSQNKLTAGNIDRALDALESETHKQIIALRSMTESQIDKISLFKYELSGISQLYCEVDRIEELIKEQITDSIHCLGLSPLWLGDRYVNNRYLFLLGKLDEHIIERDLNYPLYKSGDLDRKINLNLFFDWLTCGDIEIADDFFYQFQLKEIFASISNRFCERCNLGKCDTCLMPSAINKIGQMSFDEMKCFLTLTNPNNCEGLSVSTISNYMSWANIGDPFLVGIRDIDIPFEADQHAITYIDKETVQYILTTIVMNDLLDDPESICSNIANNRELYELLMDYDCFISKNMTCASVVDANMRIGKGYIKDENLNRKMYEHIAHLKNTRIVKLTDFISQIERKER